MRVQCKGSGVLVHVGFAKRALCPSCGTMKDLTGQSRFKKHMRVVTKQQLRKMGG